MTKTTLQTALVSAAAVAAMCSCEATGGGNFFTSREISYVDWRWPKRTSYETTPLKDKTFFLQVQDLEGSEGIMKGLKEGLLTKLKTEHGLELEPLPNQADYACYVYIRYFNTSPKKKADSDLLEDHPLIGGQQGWLDDEGVAISAPPNLTPIPPRGAGGGWELMIDIVVGEKIDGQEAKRLRSGRLLGRVDVKNREDALSWFREGRAPKPSGEASIPANQPEHLVQALSKGIFRVSDCSELGPLPEKAQLTPEEVNDEKPKVVDLRLRPPSFKSEPAVGDTFFLSVSDCEEDDDLYRGLRDGLRRRLVDGGLVCKEAPEEAKYACYLFIRYFNGTPKNGASVLESTDTDFIGGRKGWKLLDMDDFIESPPSIDEIKPMLGNDGWGLLIDIAVGEQTESGEVVLRSGRLVANIPGASRNEALWLLRTNDMPPRSVKPAEGQPPLPLRYPDPPSELVKAISKALFPLPIDPQ